MARYPPARRGELVGIPATDPAQVRLLRSRYHAREGLGPQDHVVIGCCHLAFKTVAFCWLGPRYCERCGPDSADQELLEVMATSSRMPGMPK